MKIKAITVNMLQENCYIVSDDTLEAVIIDCGALCASDRSKISEYLANEHLTPVHHILTHAHYDHCFGVTFIKEQYGLAPEMHRADQAVYDGLGDGVFGGMSKVMRDAQRPLPARYLEHNDIVTFGQSSLQVLATPGHTPGGICLYNADQAVLFSGDTLFYGSVGRCDFPGGNGQQLVESIRTTLFTLPDDTVVYPGHGPMTQIGFEKQHNPYV